MKGKRKAIEAHSMIAVALIVLVILFFVSITFGGVHLTLKEVFNTIMGNGTSLSQNIVWNLRLPRVIIAILVGCNLAISGALLQAVMKNPLADPGLTGVSSGASIVAIVIMLLFPGMTKWIPLFAFFGATATCFLVYSLAWKSGLSPIRIILAGVAINAVLGSGISLLSILFSDRIQGVLLWTNGSLAGKYDSHVTILLPYTIVGVVLALITRKQANILQLGDDMTRNLGINPNITRIIISAIAAFLAGISVSVVGVIGFVGLVIPHISRMIIGSDYKYLLPFSAITGAILVLVCDTFARTAFAPIELPVGIIMSAIGGPFFLWLLRKKGG